MRSPLWACLFDSEEKALIEHPAFQRLRSIQQLSFCQRAFPSGTGNRLTHSLGASHLAGEAFDSIFSKPAARALPLKADRKKALRKALKFAALLHDTGHPPLSHAGEALLPPLSRLGAKRFLKPGPDRQARHEDYSLQLIMETGLSKIIQRAGIEPLAVARLIHQDARGGGDFFLEGGLDYLPLLRQIINSDLDVDRMDYLNRDSLSCGVKYGLTDFMWLLSHFDCHVKEGRLFLAVGADALCAVESFLLGRRHMRAIVYFHHKTVIYNHILKKYADSCGWTLPSDTEAYLQFEDGRLLQKLGEAAERNEWARRIVRREPYIRLYERSEFSLRGSAKPREDLLALLEGELKANGVPLIKIDSKKHAIKPPEKIQEEHLIFLKGGGLDIGGQGVAGQARPLFEEGGPPLSLPPKRIERIYAAPEKREKAKQILDRLLKQDGRAC